MLVYTHPQDQRQPDVNRLAKRLGRHRGISSSRPGCLNRPGFFRSARYSSLSRVGDFGDPGGGSVCEWYTQHLRAFPVAQLCLHDHRRCPLKCIGGHLHCEAS